MKKLYMLAVLLVAGFILSGCNEENIEFINLDEVKKDTLFVKEDGSVQVVTFEGFEEEYYDLGELKVFIEKELTEYNNQIGKEVVGLAELQKRNQEALMMLEFSSIYEYGLYEDRQGEFFHMENANQEQIDLIPETMVRNKNGKEIEKEKIVKGGKYKVLLINGDYEVLTGGRIMYYTKGAKLLDRNKIESYKGETTIVIYK